MERGSENGIRCRHAETSEQAERRGPGEVPGEWMDRVRSKEWGELIEWQGKAQTRKVKDLYKAYSGVDDARDLGADRSRSNTES